jgi:hypothetical protein
LSGAAEAFDQSTGYPVRTEDPAAPRYRSIGHHSRVRAGEDEIAELARLVTTEGLRSAFSSGLLLRIEQSPSSPLKHLAGIFDHELNIRMRPHNERLLAAEDLIVFV